MQSDPHFWILMTYWFINVGSLRTSFNSIATLYPGLGPIFKSNTSLFSSFVNGKSRDTVVQACFIHFIRYHGCWSKSAPTGKVVTLLNKSSDRCKSCKQCSWRSDTVETGSLIAFLQGRMSDIRTKTSDEEFMVLQVVYIQESQLFFRSIAQERIFIVRPTEVKHRIL